jgi:hypothetical protein
LSTTAPRLHPTPCGGSQLEEVSWRPTPDSSAIGWHLGRARRSLHAGTSAPPTSPGPAHALMDSASLNPAAETCQLDQLAAFRRGRSTRIHALDDCHRRSRCRRTPRSNRTVGRHLLTLLINHEYQHDRWIGEVRSDLPRTAAGPSGACLTLVDNYLTLAELPAARPSRSEVVPADSSPRRRRPSGADLRTG